MIKTKQVQLRTALSGNWQPSTQAVDLKNPTCAHCGNDLWAMGKTVYCNANSPKHVKVAA